mgnify:CR=1 FL=1
MIDRNRLFARLKGACLIGVVVVSSLVAAATGESYTAYSSKIDPGGAALGLNLGGGRAPPAGDHRLTMITRPLSLPGRRELFVIGDMSALTGANGKPVPGLAAAAAVRDSEGSPEAATGARDSLQAESASAAMAIAPTTTAAGNPISGER